MLDYVYTGWGAFWVTMFMFVPFALMAYWVIRRKSLVDTGPTRLQPGEFAPIEGVWLTFAFIFFVVANLASLKFIPWAAASDTQHGFAVYHPDGRVLFTMLMMPGTTKPTSVVYTFKDPGKYTVRCLEYCGVAHHRMQDELTVVKAN